MVKGMLIFGIDQEVEKSFQLLAERLALGLFEATLYLRRTVEEERAHGIEGWRSGTGL
jgi:hypothetical protein